MSIRCYSHAGNSVQSIVNLWPSCSQYQVVSIKLIIGEESFLCAAREFTTDSFIIYQGWYFCYALRKYLSCTVNTHPDTYQQIPSSHLHPHWHSAMCSVGFHFLFILLFSSFLALLLSQLQLLVSDFSCLISLWRHLQKYKTQKGCLNTASIHLRLSVYLLLFTQVDGDPNLDKPEHSVYKEMSTIQPLLFLFCWNCFSLAAKRGSNLLLNDCYSLLLTHHGLCWELVLLLNEKD